MREAGESRADGKLPNRDFENMPDGWRCQLKSRDGCERAAEAVERQGREAGSGESPASGREAPQPGREIHTPSRDAPLRGRAPKECDYGEPAGGLVDFGDGTSAELKTPEFEHMKVGSTYVLFLSEGGTPITLTPRAAAQRAWLRSSATRNSGPTAGRTTL